MLVVDDSSEVLEMLVEILETSGARVTACETAKQAVEILEQERPDVLLSDLQMPRHDGLWLIEQVRRLPSPAAEATPAACRTGLTEPEDRARVLRAGYQYHVPEPIRPERLLGIVALLALKP